MGAGQAVFQAVGTANAPAPATEVAVVADGTAAPVAPVVPAG